MNNESTILNKSFELTNILPTNRGLSEAEDEQGKNGEQGVNISFGTYAQIAFSHGS